MQKLTDFQIKKINKNILIGSNKQIVLVDTTSDDSSYKEDCNANIYCIDNLYNILWQVNDSKGMRERDSFTYINLLDSGKLEAVRFFGKKYLIDIACGSAEEVGWNK